MTENQPKKILLIRMLGLGDVTCIGIPALRYFRDRFPEAELHFLTFSAGEDVLKLAEPDVKVMSLGKDEWPENIIPAMETFLGLAEQIVGEGYYQIVNLDTWFMPCFLARFLKDAGENVIGNFMSISVQELIDQFQSQQLKPEYVHDPARYMLSSFFCMDRWHMPWWQNDVSLPTGGYPEFYLRSCCSFDIPGLDMSIDVEADKKLTDIARNKKVIALAPQSRTPERAYPFAKELQQQLEDAGYHVWTGFDGSVSMQQTLSQLKASDLLITAPSAPQWLATSVNCPILVISGAVDPRTLMPDFATDMHKPCPVHAPSQDNFGQRDCLCVKPESLVESVDSIFAEENA